MAHADDKQNQADAVSEQSDSHGCCRGERIRQTGAKGKGEYEIHATGNHAFYRCNPGCVG